MRGLLMTAGAAIAIAVVALTCEVSTGCPPKVLSAPAGAASASASSSGSPVTVLAAPAQRRGGLFARNAGASTTSTSVAVSKVETDARGGRLGGRLADIRSDRATARDVRQALRESRNVRSANAVWVQPAAVAPVSVLAVPGGGAASASASTSAGGGGVLVAPPAGEVPPPARPLSEPVLPAAPQPAGGGAAASSAASS